LLVLIPGVLAGVYKVLNDTKVGDRVLLAAPDLNEVTPYQNEQARLAQLIGHPGTAVTPLVPGGMVSVDGERLHAFTEGLLVEQGGDIEVVAVRGTRVLVKPRTTAAADSLAATNGASTPHIEAAASAPPLDFDVPQS
jgi:membrane-bound serine protease (ClpP class)